jgi:hypothetical protein
VIGLGIKGKLRRTLESTNACESMIDTVRTTQRNVKHWSSGEMGLRWTAAGMLEAEKQFRKVIGHTDLPGLAIAIERQLHLHQPNPPTTRRPRSQSLCNDHTGTVVTEIPRRPGQPPRERTGRKACVRGARYRSSRGEDETEVRRRRREPIRPTGPSLAHNLNMNDELVTAIERLAGESLDAGRLPAEDALPGVRALDLWREEPNGAMLFWVDQAADLCGLRQPVLHDVFVKHIDGTWRASRGQRHH